MKSTITNAAIKQPAAILAVRRLVDAKIKTIPQNDEPRSGDVETVQFMVRGIIQRHAIYHRLHTRNRKY